MKLVSWYVGLHHFSPRVCHYWAAVSDFWRLPGLRHFRTVAELRAMLQEDQTPVLEVMRAAHEQSVREATEFWSWSIPLVLEGRADLARAECFPHGLGAHFWINILLTILGYFPGVIHAIYIIAKK